MGNGEWLAQLPDDLKSNETLTKYETIGDFAKEHLTTLGRVAELDGTATELNGKITDLEGRLANAIPKLGENPTPEEIAAFHSALGVPDDPSAYEFEAAEGVEHDEKMVAWARETFKAANLTPAQAKVISKAWDGFVAGMTEAEQEHIAQGIKAADEALKEKWKNDYEPNLVLTKRGFQAFEKVAPGFSELLDMELPGGQKVGNHPAMLEVFFDIGRRIGDDGSLPDFKPTGEKDKSLPGDAKGNFATLYTKTPA